MLASGQSVAAEVEPGVEAEAAAAVAAQEVSVEAAVGRDQGPSSVKALRVVAA
jgi:hypothetical protein